MLARVSDIGSERHTQVTSCENPPPRIGPVTEPTLHMAERIPKYWPRRRRGTRSVTITSLSAIKPPPPTPCTDRPTSMYVKSLATEQTTVPTKNRVRAMRMSGRRPKMLDSEAKLGWNTASVSQMMLRQVHAYGYGYEPVDAKRNDVPLQKASIAVPPRSRVMICTHKLNSSYQDSEYEQAKQQRWTSRQGQP
jgi:hypothetical protein